MIQKQAIYKVLIISVFMFIFMFFSVLTCSAGELIINRTWLDGDMLRIEATDINGVTSTLALRLSDYVNDTQNEFISLQAADLNGNKSDIMQIKNPYYLPLAADTDETADITVAVVPPEQSSAQNGSNAFTPDGTGTVLDNVTNSDGKEFFTVGTEDGSFFYLIVDRERSSDNVYLLNAVTEEDLRSLAQKNGRTVESEAIPTENITEAVTEIPTVTATETQITATPAESVTEAETTTEIIENDSEIEKKDGNVFTNFLANIDFTMLIIIVVVMAVAGAIIFIIKCRKKNNQFYDNDDDDYEYSENTDNAVEQNDGNNSKSEENEEIVNANSETTEQETPENNNQNPDNGGDNDENDFEDGAADDYN